MDEFTRAYIAAMLWAETDDNDDPFDKNYGPEDLAPETLKQIVAECAEFQREHAADIGAKFGQAGHDFWLTRNGHGAGFWDGGWPEEAGERLTEASRSAGVRYLYKGDDGKLYLS